MFDFTQLEEIRRRRPLIHCVSNIVTANDCANLALAVGASPMMAQAPEEMEAISSMGITSENISPLEQTVTPSSGSMLPPALERSTTVPSVRVSRISTFSKYRAIWRESSSLCRPLPLSLQTTSLSTV